MVGGLNLLKKNQKEFLASWEGNWLKHLEAESPLEISYMDPVPYIVFYLLHNPGDLQRALLLLLQDRAHLTHE